MPREPRWQRALQLAVRDPVRLCTMLQLPDCWHQPARRAAQQFPVVVPLEFVARMQRGNPQDPLLRQVLPLEEELHPTAGFVRDPVGDALAVRQPGLLQKYAHRALLITTPACAVHCRYCFRRHFDYPSAPRSLDHWQPAFDQLAADTQIHEIVLSGGDPLVLPDSRLLELIDQLSSIPHLRRLRIHTRLPVVIPQRITAPLVQGLAETRLTSVMVVHANHPAELDTHVADALGKLARAGITLLNQSVLLRGVNDCAEVLAALSERLLDLGVLPYYLHQLDQVTGAAHFLVDIPRGQQLVDQLRRRLPGYAVPRYVREQPGHTHKTPLA